MRATPVVPIKIVFRVLPVAVVLCVIGSHGLCEPVPFTYIIEYRPDWVGNEHLYETIAESPPDLLHVGLVAPFNTLWGAGDVWSSADRRDEKEPPQTSAERVRERIEEVTAFVDAVRSAGVEHACPYIFSMGLFGDHEKRTGFWKFYDDWDRYLEFGLGPKPQDDPVGWMQKERRKHGEHDYYFYEPCVNHPGWQQYLRGAVRNLVRCGYDGVFLDVNTMMCYNDVCQEAFDKYLASKYTPEELGENFGRSKPALAQIDLSDVYPRFEKAVLAGFWTYLGTQYTTQDRERRFGTRDLTSLHLEDDWRLLRCSMQGSRGEFVPEEKTEQYLMHEFGTTELTTVHPELRERFVQQMLRADFACYLESDSLENLLREKFGTDSLKWRGNPSAEDLVLWVETQKFWSESMAGLFRLLKEEGSRARRETGLSPEFFIDANVGTMAHIDGLNKRRVNAIDLNRWAPVADYVLFEEMQQPGTLAGGVIVDYIFGHKWAAAADTRGCMLVYKVQDECGAELAHAEAAAGGSGGAFIQAGLGAPKARQKYREYFEGHPELFEGGTAIADVGIAFFFDQVYYENIENLRETHQLVRHFSDNHVLFGLVTEKTFGEIGKYDMVILPDIWFMSDEQIATATEYVEQGGNLIIVGETATRYMNAKPRPRPGFRLLLRGAIGKRGQLVVAQYGRGGALFVEDARTLIPARAADVFNLMEERSNALHDLMGYVEQVSKDQSTETLMISKVVQALVTPTLQVNGTGVPHSLRFSAYKMYGRSRDQKVERIVLHMVNYNLPIVKDVERSVADPEPGDVWGTHSRSREPISVKEIAVTFAIPSRHSVKSVRLHEPGRRSQEIPFMRGHGMVQFLVPEVTVYTCAEILLWSPN